jgi:hypothetical protein
MRPNLISHCPVKWKSRCESDRVEDARDESPPMMAGGGGALMGLFSFVVRRFGIKGILAMLLIGGLMWKLGILDPAMLLSGGPAPQAEVSPEDQERFQFVKVVLADTEDVWTEEFARQGMEYKLSAP